MQYAPLLNKFQIKAITSGNPRLPTSFTQALYLQGLIICRVQDKKCTNMALAALARAWDLLEDRKRILRGVPLPGQLRPDLDPVQLMKAVKRSRSRKPLELTADHFTAPADDVSEPNPEPDAPRTEGKTQEKPAKTEPSNPNATKKEST